MIKKLVSMLVMIMMIFMFTGISYGGNIDVQMSNWKLGGIDKNVFADFVITNNTNKYLAFCEVTVVLYNNGKMVGSKSNLIANLKPGNFTSRLFCFRNTRSFTHYKYSISRLRFK